MRPSGEIEQTVKQILPWKDRINAALLEVIHWIMFGVSAVFSIRLFSLLGSTPLDTGLYSVLAVAFEGAKIMLWEIGTKVQKGVAIAFVGVSLIASTAVAVAISERTRSDGVQVSVTDSFESRLSEYTNQIGESTLNIANIENQIKALPPAYTTSVERLTKLRVDESNRRIELQTKRNILEDEYWKYKESKATHTERTMFTMLADILKMTESMFTLLFMLIVSVLLEIGALITTKRSHIAPRGQKVTKEEIAKCICGSNQVSLDRLPNGKYIVRCRSCSRNTMIHATEQEARFAWKGL